MSSLSKLSAARRPLWPISWTERVSSIVVLVDMDDTIEQLLPAWLVWLNHTYGCSVKPEDITSWDIWRAYPELEIEQVYAPLYDDAFWSTVKPVDGAPENLQKLIEAGHEVYIVTASHFLTLASKMQSVLFRYFPFITWDHVIVTSRKQLVDGDVRIDDGPHNLRGASGLRILVEAPHNRSFDAERYGIVRAKTWPEIYQIVCKHASLLRACEEDSE